MPQPEKTETKEPRLTGRKIAKFAASTAVQIGVTRIAARAMTDYLGFESDDFITKFGSRVVGFGTAEILEPVTDKIVDRSIDFSIKRVTEFRTNRQDKKANAQKNPEKE